MKQTLDTSFSASKIISDDVKSKSYDPDINHGETKGEIIMKF
jgi:hypothetical protein